jgi:hypothetical protein
VGKLEGKRPLGRIRHRWENNINIDLRNIGWCGMNWIDPVQNRDPLEGSSECANEPLGSIKHWTILK